MKRFTDSCIGGPVSRQHLVMLEPGHTCMPFDCFLADTHLLAYASLAAQKEKDSKEPKAPKEGKEPKEKVRRIAVGRQAARTAYDTPIVCHVFVVTRRKRRRHANPALWLLRCTPVHSNARCCLCPPSRTRLTKLRRPQRKPQRKRRKRPLRRTRRAAPPPKTLLSAHHLWFSNEAPLPRPRLGAL